MSPYSCSRFTQVVGHMLLRKFRHIFMQHNIPRVQGLTNVRDVLAPQRTCLQDSRTIFLNYNQSAQSHASTLTAEQKQNNRNCLLVFEPWLITRNNFIVGPSRPSCSPKLVQSWKQGWLTSDDLRTKLWIKNLRNHTTHLFESCNQILCMETPVAATPACLATSRQDDGCRASCAWSN